MLEPQVVLREVFGFTEFRPLQMEVIEHVLIGGSGLLVMPTGGGKSLTFQIPARILSSAGKGMTLVVSPLIALMKDQVDAAKKKGLQAEFINSSISREERVARQARLSRGEYELVYITPERFRKEEFQAALKTQKIALLAIDEAHCISQWGHDFRPDYSRLAEWKGWLGNPPTLALTASATQRTIEDIKKIAESETETETVSASAAVSVFKIWNQGVRRPNIAMKVIPVYGLEEKVRGIVAQRYHRPGPSIVYVSLVQTLEKLSRELDRLNIAYDIYHGQLPDGARRRAQERWLKSDSGMMLATPAFGLGIDKPNVRWVLHAELPGSLEAWTQEVGRAGRDGQPADALTFYDGDDISIQTDFVNWSNPDPSFILGLYQLIERNPLRVRQEGYDFLREQLNFYNKRDFRVETAINLLERWGALEGKDPRNWKLGPPPEGEFVDQKLWETRIRGQKEKLHALVSFLISPEGCRAQEVERYFGLPSGAACGICDHCAGPFQA